MADVRFCVGFSKVCKQAREGGGLPGSAQELRCVTPDGCLTFFPRRPFLPPDIVRLIDALVRRLEHEDTLLSMNGGDLGATLCEAANEGSVRDVRFLLARGANGEHMTTFTDENGTRLAWTALSWAAHGGHVAVCMALLDAGAGESEVALNIACHVGHTPVVALLLDHGADVHHKNDTPLINAAQDGHLTTVTLLLDRGADVHAQEGRSLRLAAQAGHLETVRLLLDRGADIQAQNGRRPLRNAALQGRLEVVRLLLDRGADIHADNEEALWVARHNGHAAVIALLLERGAVEPEEEEEEEEEED